MTNRLVMSEKNSNQSKTNSKEITLEYAPLFLPATGIIAGIIISHHFPVMLAIAIIVSFISLCLYIYRNQTSFTNYLLIFILSVCLGIIHYYRYNYSLPSNHIKYFVDTVPSGHKIKATLSGYIISTPTIKNTERKFPYHSPPANSTRFIVNAYKIRTQTREFQTTGLVQIYLPGIHDEFSPGQKIELSGKIAKVYKTNSANLFRRDFSDWLLQNRIFAVLSVSNADDIKIISETGLTGKLARKFRQTIQSFLFQADANSYITGLAHAMLLGERNKVENKLNEAFIRIGAAHFLAVSGFHIAILTFGVWAFATLISLQRQTVMIITMCTALIYLLLANMRPSLIRATIMIVIVCFGYIRYKRANIINSISAAAILMLLINPNQLFSIGFQLSFISLLGIVLLTGKIYKQLFIGTVNISSESKTEHHENEYISLVRWIAKQLKLLFSVSLAAAIASFPLVMIHFNLISFLGPISAVLLILPVTLFIFAGFLHLLISAIVPIFNIISSFALNVSGTLLAHIALLLSKIPGTAIYVASPSWIIVSLYYLVLFWPKNRYVRTKTRVIIILALIAIYLTNWIASAGLLSNNSQKYFLYACGFRDGQTIAISTGYNIVLIDCGCDFPGQTADLLNRMNAQYIVKPACALITTANQMFFNDIRKIHEINPNIKTLITPAIHKIATTYMPAKLLTNNNKFHLQTIKTGQKINIDNCKITILDANSNNKLSSIVLVELGQNKFLICPIMTKLSFLTIYTRWPDLKADTVICNSKTQPSQALGVFLRHINAKRLIVCGGLYPRRIRHFLTISKQNNIETIITVQTHGKLIFLKK